MIVAEASRREGLDVWCRVCLSKSKRCSGWNGAPWIDQVWGQDVPDAVPEATNAVL
jgi:hypothetical protein